MKRTRDESTHHGDDDDIIIVVERRSLPELLTWETILPEMRYEVRRRLHKLDYLSLARTCKSEWTARDKKMSPVLNVNEAVDYASQRTHDITDDYVVDITLELFKLYFAATLMFFIGDQHINTCINRESNSAFHGWLMHYEEYSRRGDMLDIHKQRDAWLRERGYYIEKDTRRDGDMIFFIRRIGYHPMPMGKEMITINIL